MGIIVMFAISYFDTLEDQQNYYNNQVTLTQINDTIVYLKTTDIGTNYILSIQNKSQISFNSEENTVTIEQDIKNPGLYSENKVTIDYGNLNVRKTPSQFIYTLDLNYIVDLNNDVVINSGNHIIDLSVVGYENNLPLIEVRYKN
jgi:hypothetical protein